MRLIIPVLLAILGALCGLVMGKLLSGSKLPPQLSALSGLLGAFIGLIVRDISDINVGNDLIATVVAALLGAAALSLIAHLTFGKG